MSSASNRTGPANSSSSPKSRTPVAASEAAFAHLCGVAPIPASSGKVERHRLNPGGNRDANCTLHIITVVRLRFCQRTRDYATRRTADGKSKKEIIRCLKRYIAREVYYTLRAGLARSHSRSPR